MFLFQGVHLARRGVKGSVIIRILEAVEELAGPHALGIVERRAAVRLGDIKPDGIYPFSTYIAVRRALEEVFGQAARIMLFRVGYTASRSLATSRFGVPAAELVKGVEGDWRRVAAAGLARIIEARVPIGEAEFSEEPGGLTVRMRDSVEPSYTSGAEAPVCHMTRGFLKYVVELLTGAKVEVSETACRAQGAPYCEFHIKRVG